MTRKEAIEYLKQYITGDLDVRVNIAKRTLRMILDALEEEKTQKVNDVVREKVDSTQCSLWKVALKAVLDALKEEHDDDLTLGDIYETWDVGLMHRLSFYCGEFDGRRQFSIFREHIGHPEKGFPFDHYRKIDAWDLVSKEIYALHLFDKNGSIVERLERPEGR